MVHFSSLLGLRSLEFGPGMREGNQVLRCLDRLAPHSKLFGCLPEYLETQCSLSHSCLNSRDPTPLLYEGSSACCNSTIFYVFSRVQVSHIIDLKMKGSCLMTCISWYVFCKSSIIHHIFISVCLCGSIKLSIALGFSF